MRGRSSRLEPGGVGDDDFRAVIHPSFGRFPEHQLVALDLGGGVGGDKLVVSSLYARPTDTACREDCASCVFFFFTMTFPPPGVWLVLLMEPTLARAFSLKSSFTFSIRTLPPPVDGTEGRRREVSNPQGKETRTAHRRERTPLKNNSFI